MSAEELARCGQVEYVQGERRDRGRPSGCPSAGGDDVAVRRADVGSQFGRVLDVVEDQQPTWLPLQPHHRPGGTFLGGRAAGPCGDQAQSEVGRRLLDAVGRTGGDPPRHGVVATVPVGIRERESTLPDAAEDDSRLFPAAFGCGPGGDCRTDDLLRALISVPSPGQPDVSLSSTQRMAFPTTGQYGPGCGGGRWPGVWASGTHAIADVEARHAPCRSQWSQLRSHRSAVGDAWCHDPLGGLAGEGGDHVEVAVVVEDGQPVQLRCGGDEKVGE